MNKDQLVLALKGAPVDALVMVILGDGSLVSVKDVVIECHEDADTYTAWLRGEELW